jgi:hypothetical protein
MQIQQVKSTELPTAADFASVAQINLISSLACKQKYEQPSLEA